MSKIYTSDRRSVLLGLSASVFMLDANAQTLKPDPAPAPTAPLGVPAAVDSNLKFLRAAPMQKRLKTDFAKEAAVLAFNETVPGPLLRIKKGASLAVRLTNALDAPTSLHWYGVRGQNNMDGVAGLTQPAVKPGETFDYRLTPPDGGMFWYHPLVIGHTAEQVDRGLSGLLLVEEPDAPVVDQDLAVIIDDWRLTQEGEIIKDFNGLVDISNVGRLGNWLSVNGIAAPQEIKAPAGGRIRLRFLNASNARICPLKFEQVHASVIAIDGQPCDPFDPLRRTVIMAPGSRFDMIVDIPSDENTLGTIGISLSTTLPLLAIKGEGKPVSARPPLVALAGNGLPPAIRLQDAQRSELVISGGMARSAADGRVPDVAQMQRQFPDRTKIWLLNGGSLAGFAGKPLLSVKRGTPIVLSIANRTAVSQVIHVHGHNFRLLHAFDDGWEPYFLDTLFIGEGKTALISFVADNPGKWAIRSSILEHFEGGVATWFEVI